MCIKKMYILLQYLKIYKKNKEMIYVKLNEYINFKILIFLLYYIFLLIKLKLIYFLLI